MGDLHQLFADFNLPSNFRILTTHSTYAPQKSRLLLPYSLHGLINQYFITIKRILRSLPDKYISEITHNDVSYFKIAINNDFREYVSDSIKEKLLSLYELYDIILSDFNQIEKIEFNNFIYRSYDDGINIFPLVSKLNFNILKDIDVSFTYLSNETIMLFNQQLRTNFNLCLERFCFYNIRCDFRGDYLIFIKTVIYYFKSFNFIMNDQNIRHRYDDIISIILENPIQIVYLSYDNFIQFGKQDHTTIQTRNIFDICQKLISANHPISQIKLLIYMNNADYSSQQFKEPNIYTYEINDYFIKIVDLLKNNDQLQKFSFGKHIQPYCQTIRDSNSLNQKLRELFKINGIIEIEGNFYHHLKTSTICLKKSNRNESNNLKRNQSLFETILDNIDINKVYDSIISNSRKRSTRTNDSSSEYDNLPKQLRTLKL